MVTKFLNIDTDSSLTANSNERVPSQKAIKTYTDAIDTAKQNKTLTTPITVGAIEETTVEGALGGINTSLSTKQDQTLSSSITVAGTPQTTVEGALSAINTVAGSAVQPSDLATVATTGSYNDLINQPIIPAAQVQSDWDESDESDVAYIKNKPHIPSEVIVDQTYNASSTNAQSGTAVAQAISTKQDILTAGDNITINNNIISAKDTTYIAGTGIAITEDSDENLVISSTQTSAEWGNISGTLSNQTDLQNALNAKQDTLVSGTNIKTVNGNSLLGSGNIAIEIPANIWTQDNLVAGDNVTFTKTINPNVLDPNTALACYHFNGNADNLIQNGVGLSSGFLQSINSYASESVYPWYSGYKSAILKRNSDWDGGIFSSLPSEFVSSDYTLDFRIRNVDSIYGIIRLFAGQNNSIYPRIDCMNGRQWIFYSSSSSSSTVSVTQNTWYHIAFVRHEGVTKIYFNGVEKASTSEQTSITNFLLHIGGGDEKQGIAELALVKEAKWTSNFTVPSEPYSLGIGSIYQVNATSQLPSQTGQSGKFLTTDGTDASWANVDALPSQTGQSGKFLTTDGTAASWADIPDSVIPDNVTIDLNESDEIQTIGIIDQKTSSANKFWTGTKAEYDAIVTKDTNTTYRTTDENETVYQNSYRIGQVLPSILPISDYGLHLLDGAVIDGTGIYSSFYSYIAGLVSTYPNLFISEADWQTAINTYGVCGKFVYDSTNQTIRLPKITGIIEGTTDVTALGDLVQAGLPNITGGMSPTGLAGVSNSYGAFYDEVSNTTDYSADTRWGYGVRWGFNASRSSSIYGNSNTVQPQTIKVYYYIVIANSYQTPTGVQISKVATDLNGKVNLNSSWGFPTGQYIDLTLGASGTTYTAPADGYVAVAKLSTANLQNITIDSNGWRAFVWANAADINIFTWLPVKKGADYQVYYNLGGATAYFRFYYAQKDNN